MGPSDLHALADELLAASVEALDTIPMFAPGLGGAPERRFVSPGQPALDCCDQLAVNVTGVSERPGTPAGRSATTGRVNWVGLAVTITRCIATSDNDGQPPTPDEIENGSVTKGWSGSDQTDADAWVLWNHLFNLVEADLLFSLCGEVFWDGLRSLNPSGGCGGSVLSLRVSLDGYNETFGS